MSDAYQPYHIGGPLLTSSKEYAYVERAVEKLAKDRIEQSIPFRIIDPPHLGKTSLIHWLSRNLTGHCFAVASLDTLPDRNEKEWYTELRNRLLLGIPIQSYQYKDFTRPTNASSWHHFLEELAEYARKTQQRIVIVLDDISNVSTQAQSWVIACVRNLRDVFNNRAFYHPSEDQFHLKPLTYVLCGRLHGYKCDDVSQRILLHDFEPKHVSALVKYLGLSERQTKSIAREIYKWTNGHPYLTQYVCYLLALQGVHKNVKEAVEELFNEDTAHFPLIMHELENTPGLKEYMKRFFNGHKPDLQPHQLITHPQMRKLESIGFIKRDSSGGDYRVRNEIYFNTFSSLFSDDGSHNGEKHDLLEPMNHEDTERLVTIMAYIASTDPVNPQRYFKQLVLAANIPTIWRWEIADNWSGNPQNDARALVRWAIAKKTNELDPGHTTLGSILAVLVPPREAAKGDGATVGIEDAKTIVRLMAKYQLMDQDLLEKLQNRYLKGEV